MYSVLGAYVSLFHLQYPNWQSSPSPAVDNNRHNARRREWRAFIVVPICAIILLHITRNREVNVKWCIRYTHRT